MPTERCAGGRAEVVPAARLRYGEIHVSWMFRPAGWIADLPGLADGRLLHGA